jgi:hypothetical protein
MCHRGNLNSSRKKNKMSNLNYKNTQKAKNIYENLQNFNFFLSPEFFVCFIYFDAVAPPLVPPLPLDL